MSPKQIIPIVWARRKLALAIWLLCVVATAGVSYLIPKEYTATASLVLDVKADPISGMFLPATATPGYMATQIDIIQSNRVAERVVKAIRFDQSAEVRNRWREETRGQIPIERYYGELLLKGLRITPARGSNVIHLAYTGPDAQFSSAVANAFAQAYIETNIELRAEPATQYANWFDARARVLRRGVEESQARLMAYQKDNGLVGSQDRVDLEAARLADLSTRLGAAQAERAEWAGRERNLAGDTSSEIQQNPAIQGIKAELARVRVQLAAIEASAGSNHPMRRQLEAQVEALDKQLAQEARRVRDGIATSLRAAAQKEDSLRALVDAQKVRMASLRVEVRGNSDALAVLVKDVENAQKSYETVVQRMSQVSLESKSDQTNVHMLSPAVQPLTPSRPKLALNVLAAVAAGAVLACLAALGMEALDPRVRGAADLFDLPNVPLLGVMRPDVDQRTLRGRLAARLRLRSSERAPIPALPTSVRPT